MTFRIVLLLALQTNLVLFAQNLIPNSSFEIGECPSGHSIKPRDFKVDFWLSADGGTPDYFHDCGKNNTGERLLNWAGGQYAVEGSGYIGIYLKKGLYQENIGIKLIEKLRKGVLYKGQFYICRAANSEFFPEEISIALVKDPIPINLLKAFDHRQMTFPLQKPRELDSFSWEKVIFQYLANGDEEYLYIGSLHKETRLKYENTARIEMEPMLNRALYVFLDNFYLGEENAVPETTSPSFDLVEELRPISIYYEFNESSIKDIDTNKLDSLAHSLIGADYQLLITGSTDSVGTDSYNSELGLKRAMVVKQHLMFAGVSGNKIEVKTKGESTPNYPNHSEAYRSLNRSALIEFFIKAK